MTHSRYQRFFKRTFGLSGSATILIAMGWGDNVNMTCDQHREEITNYADAHALARAYVVLQVINNYDRIILRLL